MLQISMMNRNGLRGLGDALDTAKTLQLSANRYASAIGRAPLAVDGRIGSLTLAMVRAALQFLVTKNISAATSSGLLVKVTSVSTLAASASGLGTFLNDAMDSIRVASYAPSPTMQTMSFIGNEQLLIAAQSRANTAAAAGIAPGLNVLDTRLPVSSTIVGLSPGVKQALMIGGGIVIGLIVLKKFVL